MNWLRLFFLGGVTSYRALFAWINPWVFVPMLIVYPVFQILFFVYLGRSAGVGSDSFFLIGDSFVAAALAGLFGMGHSVGGERRFQTLPLLLVSGASRTALFLGRAVPTIANGFVVAAVSFGLAELVVGVRLAGAQLGDLSVALAVSCFACAAFGLCIGALGLSGRSVSVFADAVGAILLVLSGANVPLTRLPEWVRTIGSFVPLTHGIEAARSIVKGSGIGDVSGLLGKELALGLAYFVAGMALVRFFELRGRQTGSLERF